MRDGNSADLLLGHLMDAAEKGRDEWRLVLMVSMAREQ